ncbi:hypothetical protein EDC96DRAFT_13518 [Choanephora cucurbitarum]|nr:hypothetical protein EDC96DRAFT_13518 [Choanephora cucurbitarum]
MLVCLCVSVCVRVCKGLYVYGFYLSLNSFFFLLVNCFIPPSSSHHLLLYLSFVLVFCTCMELFVVERGYLLFYHIMYQL